MTVNAAWNIANFRMPLVQALLDDGHRITVLAPEDHAAHKLVDAGCEYVHLPMDIKGLNPLRDIGLFLRFRKYFNEIKPDIVLGFTIKNNLFGALAAKSLGLRFLPNVTGLGTAFLSGGLLLQIARVLYVVAFHRLPVIFFQNRDDRDLFVDLKIVTPDQTRLLPGSGIDLTAFVPAPYPDDNDALRFLFVGRVIRDKGVVEFVEAARIVRQARSEIRCQILGEIGFANRSGIPRAEVNGWVKEGAIEYLGTTSDVRPLISQAHCVVLPSYREGAPRTLIEGAALARPSIATDVPGCNAVVDKNVTGLLCEVHDARDLAEQMLTFAALPTSERIKMGIAAREHIERNYSVERVIDAYRQSIESLFSQ